MLVRPRTGRLAKPRVTCSLRCCPDAVASRSCCSCSLSRQSCMVSRTRRVVCEGKAALTPASPVRRLLERARRVCRRARGSNRVLQKRRALRCSPLLPRKQARHGSPVREREAQGGLRALGCFAHGESHAATRVFEPAKRLDAASQASCPARVLFTRYVRLYIRLPEASSNLHVTVGAARSAPSTPALNAL